MGNNFPDFIFTGTWNGVATQSAHLHLAVTVE